MNATRFPPDLIPQFRRRLAENEAELAERLGHSSVLGLDTDEVTDFKVLAQEAALATVDEAQAVQALAALREVQAARQRLDSGHYGNCIECGEPIDLRRLEALPATPWCANCRQLLEHERQRARGAP